MTKTVNPAEFDARELEVYKELWEMENYLQGIWNLVHAAVGDTRVSNGYGRPKSWAGSNGEAMDKLVVLAASGTVIDVRLRMTPAEVLRRFQETEHRIEDRRLVIQAMEAEYDRDPWTRWFKCTNADGHVHSSLRGCPTVRFDTGMAWITEMSGQDRDAAVADPRLGPTLCSVCFPGAPVELRRTQRDVDRAARDAAKLARAEARFVKQLREGEQFRAAATRERITTVAACKDLVRTAAETEAELEWFQGSEARAQWAAHGPEGPATLNRVIGNMRERLAAEQADAAEANRVLFAREDAAPGTGWTEDDAARAVANKVKATRKAYGLS
jgi:hypothetical protein